MQKPTLSRGRRRRLLFSDDFETGKTENWELEPGWGIEREADRYVLEGEGHSWARLRKGDEWADYSFRCRIKLIRGGIHLNYRVSEKGRYIIGFRQDGLYLQEEEPWGEFFDLAASDSRHELGIWHDFEIVGKGLSLRVYVNGVLEMDFTDADPLTWGSIAFETLENSYAKVDEVKVELIAGTMLPDLTLELWNDPLSNIRWLSPYPPVKDKLTTVSVVVKNVGSAVDGSFIIELHVDKKLAKTWTFPSEAEKLDLEKAGKKALFKTGETRSYTHEVKFPKAGKHTFHWIVDPKSAINELNKKNNKLMATAIWHDPSELPDLVVEDISHDGEPVVGQEVTWKIKIKNDGKVDVDVPFMTSLKNADGVQFGAFWLNYLAAGHSTIFKTKQHCSSAGTETIIVTVDAGGVVNEYDKSNNTKAKQFIISYVDLQVENLVVKPDKPTICDEIVVSFAVKNNGPGTVTKPFHVSVYPGKVVGGMTQPIDLEFPKNKLPLIAGQSVPLQHKVYLSYAGDYQVVVTADSKMVYIEKDKENTLTKVIRVGGMLNGRLLEPTGDIDEDRLEKYINSDPTLDWFRKKVAITALEEAKKGLCGDDARNRYSASGSWCSEFARWVYLKSGMNNIGYPSGAWTVHLSDVTLNKQLVKLFDYIGLFKWRNKNQVTPQTAEVGDYVSMMTEGKKKNHAGIIVAVNEDNKNIWTVEGNVGDCVCLYGQRPYFLDGMNLDGNIDGIGKLHMLLFMGFMGLFKPRKGGLGFKLGT